MSQLTHPPEPSGSGKLPASLSSESTFNVGQLIAGQVLIHLVSPALIFIEPLSSRPNLGDFFHSVGGKYEKHRF